MNDTVRNWLEFRDYEVKPYEVEEQGGFIAYCPRLNIRWWGETEKEAIEGLDELKADCLERWAKEGIEIPYPPVPEPTNRVIGRVWG